ncbi:MAG: [acyl-carrier-protein] S-malonyltransferase [Rickettsiales bacterium]|nr:[acyl-carrier-protein] S-malonyltransferase [Rickettsiales bacterium]
MTTALIFPGQGSQAVGMGQALAENFAAARAVFEEVDDALNQHLSKIMFEGPEADLTATENTQPAIMACSIAALRVMEAEMGFKVADAASFVAGHSLGEYAALTAAGTFTLAEAAKLLRIRGEAMQAAVPAGEGAMAAIIGPSFDEVQAIANEANGDGEICEVANYNNDQQIVLSGSAKGIERAIEIAKEKGAKRAVPLAVSAPFHCSLMQPAAERMAQALADADVKAPCVSVVANVNAQAVSDAATIRDLLVQQVTSMVKWRESVSYMKDQGVDRMIEIGHGNVLSGLVKRIDRDIVTVNISQPADLDGFAKAA